MNDTASRDGLIEQLIGQSAEHVDEDQLQEKWVSLPTADQAYIADQLVLDALLSALRPRWPADTEAALARAMAAVASEDNSAPRMPSRPARLTTRLTLWTIGSVIALFIAVFLYLPGDKPLDAAAFVERSLAATLAPVDRQYQVVVRIGGLLGDVTGTLFVRSNTHGAIRLDASIGRIWAGFNPDNAWLVPAFGPVLVGTDPQWLQQRLEKDGHPMPVLEVATVLQRLRKTNYQMTIEGGPAAETVHIHATQPHRRIRPNNVDLWADNNTGVVKRLLLSWNGESAAPQGVEILYEGDVAQRDDWYTHPAHHGPDRPVVQRP